MPNIPSFPSLSALFCGFPQHKYYCHAGKSKTDSYCIVIISFQLLNIDGETVSHLHSEATMTVLTAMKLTSSFAPINASLSRRLSVSVSIYIDDSMTLHPVILACFQSIVVSSQGARFNGKKNWCKAISWRSWLWVAHIDFEEMLPTDKRQLISCPYSSPEHHLTPVRRWSGISKHAGSWFKMKNLQRCKLSSPIEILSFSWWFIRHPLVMLSCRLALAEQILPQ